MRYQQATLILRFENDLPISEHLLIAAIKGQISLNELGTTEVLLADLETDCRQQRWAQYAESMKQQTRQLELLHAA